MNVNCWKFFAVAALSSLFFVAAGSQEESRSYSCHLCRNRQSRQVNRFFWISIKSTTRSSTHFPIPKEHVHDWFQYSRFQSLGYKGWLQTSVACKTNMYRDNKLTEADFSAS
ncbi:hypothetical protein B1R32_109129 [Abditibacterium utsteinense]|uniref:Secreted protein n=1 Tax=Abditibacterium utsteinense TaxID=1960156 RepID=A0A2S8SSS4_9BACT|nr:hypothetical protein B1R32_109129 [Abditibacterium utsteinense]